MVPPATHGHLVGGQPHLALQVGVVVRRHLGIVRRLLRHRVGIEGTPDGMAILFEGEAVVPSDRPLAVVDAVRVQREVLAAVQVTRVAAIIVAKAVLIRAAGVGRGHRRWFAAAGLMGSGRTLFPQRVGAGHRDAVKLLQQAVDGGILGRPTPADNGLQREGGRVSERREGPGQSISPHCAIF